jgi:hypothetical protein
LCLKSETNREENEKKRERCDADKILKDSKSHIITDKITIDFCFEEKTKKTVDEGKLEKVERTPLEIEVL